VKRFGFDPHKTEGRERMKTVLIAVSLVFIGTLLPIGTSSGRSIQDTGTTEPAKKQISVDEDLLIVFEDEPHEKFQQAREYFLEGNLKASAKDIRKGAAYLKLEERRLRRCRIRAGQALPSDGARGNERR
jgi:hypothetical protein